MTVNLYDVLTVLSVAWVFCLCVCMIDDSVATVIVALITLLSFGILLYQLGRCVAFFAGA